MTDSRRPQAQQLTMLPPAVAAKWPYAPRFARVNGWRMHYIDEGSGDPVVLLHGNPTWGFLYREFVGQIGRASCRERV
jgi:haloalkane dehalogenase